MKSRTVIWGVIIICVAVLVFIATQGGTSGIEFPFFGN